MKSIILALFVIPNALLAQQQFFVYKYNGLYGLTKLDGTTLIEGEFKSHDNRIKDYALFEDNNKKQILIHLETGKKDVFDEFEGNSFFLENQYFANVEQQKKHFLWSQKTGERLAGPKALQNLSFQDVYMINKDYLYAISYETIYPPTPKAKPAPKAQGKAKVPVIQPPERLSYPKQVTYVYIFKNERNMPLVNKIEVDEEKLFGGKNPNSVFDFYTLKKKPKNVKEEANSQDYIETQRTWNPEIKPWHFYYDASFDVASILLKDSIRIMDGNFKVLKTIKYTEDLNEKDAVELFFSNRYPEEEVRLSYADFSPAVGMGSSSRKAFWQIQKTDTNYEISYLKDDKYIPYLRVDAAEAKLTYDDNLIIKDSANNELLFQLDKTTLQLPIPLKYKQHFKLEELTAQP